MKRMSALFKKMIPDEKIVSGRQDDALSGDESEPLVFDDDVTNSNFLHDVVENDLFFLGTGPVGYSDKRYDELLEGNQPLCQLDREDREVIVCVLTPVLIEKGCRPVVAEGWVAQLLQEHNNLTVAELASVIDGLEVTDTEALAPDELAMMDEVGDESDEFVLPDQARLAERIREQIVPELHHRKITLAEPENWVSRATGCPRAQQAIKGLRERGFSITSLRDNLPLIKAYADNETILPAELLNRLTEKLHGKECD